MDVFPPRNQNWLFGFIAEDFSLDELRKPTQKQARRGPCANCYQLTGRQTAWGARGERVWSGKYYTSSRHREPMTRALYEFREIQKENQLFINLIQYTVWSGWRTHGQLSWLQAASPWWESCLWSGQLDGAMTASLWAWSAGVGEGMMERRRPIWPHAHVPRRQE